MLVSGAFKTFRSIYTYSTGLVLCLKSSAHHFDVHKMWYKDYQPVKLANSNSLNLLVDMERS